MINFLNLIKPLSYVFFGSWLFDLFISFINLIISEIYFIRISVECVIQKIFHSLFMNIKPSVELEINIHDVIDKIFSCILSLEYFRNENID